MSKNCFTLALSKSAIKAISMMASRVSFTPRGDAFITMPNGYGVEVFWDKLDDGFTVSLFGPDLEENGPGLEFWNTLGESCDEYEVLGLCGKVAGRNF